MMLNECYYNTLIINVCKISDFMGELFGAEVK